MRYLPLILIGFMITPMIIWFIVAMSLPGNHTMFTLDQSYALYTLVPLTAIALGLLAWWSMRFICQTKGC